MRKAPHETAKDIFKLEMIESNTIAINIEADREFELEHAKCIYEAIQTYAEGKKLYHLFIFGDRTVPTREARHFFTSRERCVDKQATAIVANSLAQKMVFDFMINVERPSVRTKLFSSEIEALVWLQSLQN